MRLLKWRGRRRKKLELPCWPRFKLRLPLLLVVVVFGFVGVFWTTLILIWSCSTPTFGMSSVGVGEFFQEVDEDLTKITWAHAVNSIEELDDALNGDVMMLEADILMGTKRGSSSNKTVAIMAHPPNNSSDLTFEDFLKGVIKANDNNSKKGIKLDFKDIDAVTPVMKMIEKYRKKKTLLFPIWVNADVWVGPVNATTQPLDPEQFIAAVDFREYRLRPTLSIGWTTRFGTDEKDYDNYTIPITEGQYTRANMLEALAFLDNKSIDVTTREVTFPVRAGIAAQSVGLLMDLVQRAGPRASLTLWSKKDDPVSVLDLEHLIDTVGRTRVYLDLPFEMPGSTKTDSHSSTKHKNISTTAKPSRRNKDKHTKDHLVIVQDEHAPKDNSTHSGAAAITSLSFVVIISLLLIFSYCTLLVPNNY